MSSNKGKVLTVLGPIDPSTMGVTMMHEHLHLDFSATFLPPEGKDKGKEDCDFTLENVGWIRQNPYSHHSNVAFHDAAASACISDELTSFRTCGGGTVVELTTYGIGRDAALLAQYSRDTAVNVVCGTGYYLYPYQTEAVRQLTVEQMTTRSLGDITEGCPEAPHVKCGIIGEVGSNWPIHDFERRAIQAAAEVQQQTGAPVNFHPGRHPDAPAGILRLFQEAGGDAARVVMSHLDRTIHSSADLVEFGNLGTYLEFDFFGLETSHFTLVPQLDMPSDAQRIRHIKALVEAGFEEKLVISHDIHTKHRLKKFGGHGFSHILENVVPMMRIRGLAENVINKILIDNPREFMQFKK